MLPVSNDSAIKDGVYYLNLTVHLKENLHIFKQALVLPTNFQLLFVSKSSQNIVRYQVEFRGIFKFYLTLPFISEIVT